MIRSISRFFHKLARGWLILVIVAVFVPYILTTFPVVQSMPGGDIVSLDAQLFYTPQQAFATIASYGDAAPYWVRIYLTWDILNPIFYTLLLCIILSWLLQRALPPESRLRSFNALPVLGGLFDVLENIAAVILLSVYPARPVALAWVATICTVGKITFIAASLVIAVVALIAAAANRFRLRSAL